LPGGLFSKQKSQFGQILEGLKWENVGHWQISPFWYLWTKKTLATLSRADALDLNTIKMVFLLTPKMHVPFQR
jgi:hypothetical protein